MGFGVKRVLRVWKQAPPWKIPTLEKEGEFSWVLMRWLRDMLNVISRRGCHLSKERCALPWMLHESTQSLSHRQVAIHEEEGASLTWCAFATSPNQPQSHALDLRWGRLPLNMRLAHSQTFLGMFPWFKDFVFLSFLAIFLTFFVLFQEKFN